MQDSAPGNAFRLVERLQAIANGLEERWANLVEARLGLSPAQLRLLEWLADQGPATPGAVSHGLACTKGNVTGLVRRLVGKGLLERQALAADRRTVRLVLTGAGHERVIEAQALKEKFTTELSQLSPLHRLALMDLLDELAEAGLSSGQAAGKRPARRKKTAGSASSEQGTGQPVPQTVPPLRKSEAGRFVRLASRQRGGRFVQI